MALECPEHGLGMALKQWPRSTNSRVAFACSCVGYGLSTCNTFPRMIKFKFMHTTNRQLVTRSISWIRVRFMPTMPSAGVLTNMFENFAPQIISSALYEDLECTTW